MSDMQGSEYFSELEFKDYGTNKDLPPITSSITALFFQTFLSFFQKVKLIEMILLPPFLVVLYLYFH